MIRNLAEALGLIAMAVAWLLLLPLTRKFYCWMWDFHGNNYERDGVWHCRRCGVKWEMWATEWSRGRDYV